MKDYRIGDFARYLGVTPDFLKHYEELGIITPVRSESGYRYYPFHTTMLLIECIRLRNYGMTLREIREIVAAHQVETEKVDGRLEENTGHLKEEMLLDEALVREYEAFLAWKAPLIDRDFDWEIRWSRPMCFLPHTDGYDFLKDQRIYTLLKSWMSFIPIVKSSLKVENDGQVTWGFIVEEERMRQLELPTNDIVERIPPKKVFYYKFRAPILRTDKERVRADDHPAFQVLRSLGLRPQESYFRTTLMPADWQKDLDLQYGYYAIPIEV